MIPVYANPDSGGMRGRRGDSIRRALDRAGVGSALRDVREGFDPPADAERVILIGGDGTLHRALPTLIERRLGLGLVPAGTGNDFARSLGLPLDPDDAVRVAVDGPLRPVDAGDAAGTPFVCAASFGLDADIAARTREGKAGGWAYGIASLRALWRFRPRHAAIRWDGGAFEGDVTLVTAANGARYGNNLCIAPEARVDDGQLDLLIVKALPRLVLLRLFLALAAGKNPAHPAIIRARTQTVHIACAEAGDAYAEAGDAYAEAGDAYAEVGDAYAEVGDACAEVGEVYADGEPAARTPVRIGVAPGALTVACPPLT